MSLAATHPVASPESDILPLANEAEATAAALLAEAVAAIRSRRQLKVRAVGDEVDDVGDKVTIRRYRKRDGRLPTGTERAPCPDGADPANLAAHLSGRIHNAVPATGICVRQNEAVRCDGQRVAAHIGAAHVPAGAEAECSLRAAEIVEERRVDNR